MTEELQTPTQIEFDKIINFNGIQILFEELTDLDIKSGDKVRIIVKKK